MTKAHSLNENQVLILGTIGESEKRGLSGKQINEIAKIRNFRVWSNFSSSSVYYNLEKLESLGYLELRKEKGTGAGAPRKVFYITETGIEALRREGLKYLSGATGTRIDLDLGFVCAYVIPPEEIIDALRTYLATIKERLVNMERNIVAQGGLENASIPAWGVIMNSRYVLEARQRLIEELIEKYLLEI